ncbi:MAG: ABC transporter substrate-binding protein [Burkholderiales bacterium]
MRAILALLLACAAAAASAQTPEGMRRIGVLSPVSQDEARAHYPAFTERLRELGHVEGSRLAIDWRFAQGDYARLPLLAGELVKAGAEVIVTYGTPAVAAARRATASVPIVAISVADPVGSGFARSLERPGGNVTGLTTMDSAVHEKRLELLLEALPGARRIGLVVMPDNTFFTRVLPGLEAAAKRRGCVILLVNARTLRDLREGFSMLATRRADGLLIGDDPALNTVSAALAGHALHYKLPAVFPTLRGAEDGGLFGYPNDPRHRYRSAANYVDKLLRGAKAAELPFELPLKFDLAVNKKTAAAIGVTLPPAVLARANRVIE